MKNILWLLVFFMGTAGAQSINPPDLRNRLEHAERTGQISPAELADLRTRIEFGDRTGELNEREAQNLRDRVSALELRSSGRSVNPPDIRRRLEAAERAGYISAEEYASLSERIEFGDRSNELNGKEAQRLRERLRALHTRTDVISYVDLNSRMDQFRRSGSNTRELDEIDARITQGEINGILSAGEVAQLREKLRGLYGLRRGSVDSRFYADNRAETFIARVINLERAGELAPRPAYNLRRRAESLRNQERAIERNWRELERDLERSLR
mgnify:FL=1